MPIFLPENYKNRRHLRKEWGRAKTGQISPKGTVEEYEHWDGRRDATVKPAAFGMGMKADPVGSDPRLVNAILELEGAIREHERALKTRDLGWRKRTTRRVEQAKQRVIELQGG